MLFRIADEDAHLWTRDDHTHMEPRVRVRRGIDGLFEDSRPLGSQLLPRIRGMRDVLYGVAASRRVFGLEVERAEVDGVIGRAIDPMKRNTDKALSVHVFAFEVKLDGAIAELDPSKVRDAVAGTFAETKTLPGPVAETAHAAVEDLDVLGLDGSSLHGDAGSSKQDDKSRHVHRRSPPYWAHSYHSCSTSIRLRPSGDWCRRAPSKPPANAPRAWRRLRPS